MTFYESTASAAACLNARRDLLDAGGAGYIEIWDDSDTIPANVAAAIGGSSVLLGTLTLDATSFATTASNVMTANAIIDDTSADTGGTVQFYRAFTNGGTAQFQGNITASGGGGDMIINAVLVVAGGTIEITAWTITQPLGS